MDTTLEFTSDAPSVPQTSAQPRAKSATSSVVILTIGWTGSSVLAGLLEAAGFWTGPTVRKVEYDTHESVDLVRLNRKLLDGAGVGEKHIWEFRPEWSGTVAVSASSEDDAECAAFLGECDRHAPWVWKDPRLWVTIRFWDRLLAARNVKYVLLTREPLQSWVSCTLHRQVQTFGFMRRYNGSIIQSLEKFFAESGAPRLHVVYEDLLQQPERELDRLSEYLGTPVTMEHLRSTYVGKLYRKNHGARDLLLAVLVYLKNYGARLR
jgi:hypothetical protein